MDLISVIVPIYNAEKYVNQCIQSIVNQTHTNIEIILVDDGSIDSSASICRDWQSKDERITLYTKTNGGVSSARNEGLKLSCGKYVVFVDADDCISETYCEKLVSHMNDSVDMVVLGMSSFSGNTYTPIRNRLKTDLYDAAELKSYIIDDGTMSGFTMQSACAVLYRKSIIEKGNINFRTNIRYNEDGLFNTEYLFACTNCVYIDFFDIVYFYRANMESSSSRVNLLGEKYGESMSNIEIVLRRYADIYPQYNIENQMHARHVTLGLSSLMYAVKNKNNNMVSTILKTQEFREGLGCLNFKRMSKSKKLFYLVLLTRNSFLTRIALDYVVNNVRRKK